MLLANVMQLFTSVAPTERKSSIVVTLSDVTTDTGRPAKLKIALDKSSADLTDESFVAAAAGGIRAAVAGTAPNGNVKRLINRYTGHAAQTVVAGLLGVAAPEYRPATPQLSTAPPAPEPSEAPPADANRVTTTGNGRRAAAK